MDHARFDALARALGAGLTRRRFGALAAAVLALAPAASQAGCGKEGCICSADAHCHSGLICCIPGDDAGVPEGLCTVPGLCACPGEGCTCYPHQRTPCDRGLACVAVSTPAAGTCAAASLPAGACAAWGDWCPDSCGWDAPCDGCCSGHCGADGACDEQVCSAANCRCDPNDPFSCDDGLNCVPVQQPLGSRLPGGVCM
ncbi:MAG: hypothetical protein ACKOWF_10570 [Chloroflexota bacterium]